MLNPTQTLFAPNLSPLSKITSQGATLDGPLKFRGPLNRASSVSRSPFPSGQISKRANQYGPLRNTWPPYVSDAGTQFLSQHSALSNRHSQIPPSFLSQKRKALRCSPKK